MQVERIFKPNREAKAIGVIPFILFRVGRNIDRLFIRSNLIGIEFEHTCCDPKDSELCLNRLKSGESLMEGRNNSDVQIDCQI